MSLHPNLSEAASTVSSWLSFRGSTNVAKTKVKISQWVSEETEKNVLICKMDRKESQVKLAMSCDP